MRWIFGIILNDVPVQKYIMEFKEGPYNTTSHVPLPRKGEFVASTKQNPPSLLQQGGGREIFVLTDSKKLTEFFGLPIKKNLSQKQKGGVFNDDSVINCVEISIYSEDSDGSKSKIDIKYLM